MYLFLGWIILVVRLSFSNCSQPPHIIFIYVDDLGWNDVSFHGSPEIPTPNIDALALNGITLQNYYGEWLCTPSRAALLTGKYPMRLGLQHLVIKAGEASGLPLNETTLPQRLKELGYKTNMIGKWHLGYQTKDFTPTYRGFDSFFGYWNGMMDYYDHTYWETGLPPDNQPWFGMDLHDGMTPVKGAQGKYATDLFTEKAEDVIMNHDPSEPLFMFFAHLAVHAGNSYQQGQAPPEIVSQFKYIPDLNRRMHAGMVTSMDDSVGRVFKALHDRGMLDNTIFNVISDNGGEVDPKYGYASNYPLRGNKKSYWEGGIHLPAVTWSPLYELDKPRISRQLMHVSDWLPTLYTAAGGDLDDLGIIDGVNMWQAFLDDTPSPRTDMLQNSDPLSGTYAYRQGDLKLEKGIPPTQYTLWYGPTGQENHNGPATYEWVFKNGSTVRDVLQEMDMWIAEDPDELYRSLTLTCEQPPPKEAFKCNAAIKSCLFNITADPCEYYDLSDEYPEKVNEMTEIIRQYKSEEMWPQTKPRDPSANPMCYEFTYVTWMDPDQQRECDFLSRDHSSEAD